MVFKKGYKMTDEHKSKISKANKGRMQSEESKRKMSESKKRLYQEGKLVPYNLGKHHSEESKKRMSESSKGQISFRKGKKYPELSGENHPMYGKHHTLESRIKIKEARAKQIMGKGEFSPMYGKKQSKKWKEMRKNLILPKKDTSIEIKIRNFLDELTIEYFQHKYINIQHGYQCDFFIPSLNLVIECDGTYWHKYPTGREIDNIRTGELIKQGFKVLRLWEFEINNMNINEFKNRL